MSAEIIALLVFLRRYAGRTVRKDLCKSVVTATCFIVMCCLPSSFLYAQKSESEIAQSIAGCARITDDKLRLQCYDAIGGGQAITGGSDHKPVATMPEVTELAVPVEYSIPSPLSRRWELDPETLRNTFIIRLHRQNYFLPIAYNFSVNEDATLDLDRRAKAQNTEAKFQISLKAKVLEDIAGKDLSLWFAYTQLSFWQIYNSSFSSPFRETNYEPEFFLSLRTDYDFYGLKLRAVNLGINHQSNGRSEPLSRSWNRIVGDFLFEKKNFNLQLKTWYRIPENAADDDNPDIDKYLGYGELTGTYYWGEHKLSIMVRNNVRMNGNKGAIQCDWFFPIPFMRNDRFAGYIQYFNGYGESLLDYNKSVNRISLGFTLRDW